MYCVFGHFLRFEIGRGGLVKVESIHVSSKPSLQTSYMCILSVVLPCVITLSHQPLVSENLPTPLSIPCLLPFIQPPPLSLYSSYLFLYGVTFTQHVRFMGKPLYC